MGALNRNIYGQFADGRTKKIEDDIKEAMQKVFDKWSDIHSYDIEFIAHKTIAHMASMETLKDETRLRKET